MNNKKNNISFNFVKRKRNSILEKIWPPSYYWSYAEWQRRAYKFIKDNKNFDICPIFVQYFTLLKLMINVNLLIHHKTPIW